MFISYRKTSITLIVTAISLIAAPKIEFEKKTIDCGEFPEGKTDKLSAVFIVKNTGDQPLILQNVKPGCGCTVVKFDSLVQPGKSINLESSVNITGYRAGPINKNITITSNAENEPVSKVNITATILPIIDVSERFVTFDSTSAAKGFKVVLSSKKTDLKVDDVSFKANDKVNPVKFTFTPSATAAANGLKQYELIITNPKVTEDISGDIVVKTNHPDKPELIIRARASK